VPLLGTKKWVDDLRAELDLPQLQPWREWWKLGHHEHEDQVAGDMLALYGFTLLTIRGAGHLVPMDKPLASQTMLQYFLSGRLPPAKNLG
jgi:serine carboxypeptidase-like clade 2